MIKKRKKLLLRLEQLSLLLKIQQH
eukprot:SAG11_NODE_32438_length_283_cov_1.380435_1_plen_24_part_01